MSNSKIVQGVLVRPQTREMFGARIYIENEHIQRIEKDSSITSPFILPGFIDSHVHIESSMLIPSRFAQMAVKHGTIAVVADPHEVANVAGVEGIRFMVEDSKTVPLKFFFGVPSCVPASPLEKSGAIIGHQQVHDLLSEPDFYFLAEMMNFPGVINEDQDVVHKIKASQKFSKPIDGHAPGLVGKNLEKYINSGISTDHECSSIDEARTKISLGQIVQIREGSAAKNFSALSPLIEDYPQSLMFCTDDCHPDYLEVGHINKIVARAIAKGYDLFSVLTIAILLPQKHYGFSLGKLVENDLADFILVDNLEDFNVIETYINGSSVFHKDLGVFPLQEVPKPNFSFRTLVPSIENLKVVARGESMNVIEALPGELFTNWIKVPVKQPIGQEVLPNFNEDIIKIVLLDRYHNSDPVVGFIKGFKLKKGAIAASIAHDSHHILAVGANDDSLITALNWVVNNRGGLCFADGDNVDGIPLPYFGLMTDTNGYEVSKNYQKLNDQVSKAGTELSAPFMTASFMALTVIPNLKINHNGLFDVIKFTSVPLFN